MRLQILGLVVGITAVAAAATGALGVSGDTRAIASPPRTAEVGAQANCSMATALQVGKPYFFDPGMAKPINQVLCGSFTGPGSDAMAIAFTFPTCWPVQRWMVFQYADARWTRVLDQPSYVIPPLRAVGSDIREEAAVHRRGDSRCFPRGGTRARTWSWDGTRLAPGPWKQVKPPTGPPPPPAGTALVTRFRSPSGNIICAAYSRGTPFVECGIKTGLKPKPPYTAECKRLGLDHNADRIGIRSNGSRPTPPACSGDAGPFVPLRMAQVLGYGKTWRGRDGLSCRSAFTGMTCRNKRGHGFFLSRARWRTF